MMSTFLTYPLVYVCLYKTVDVPLGVSTALSALQKLTVKVISISEQETVALFQWETRCHSTLFSPSTKAVCQYLTPSLFSLPVQK